MTTKIEMGKELQDMIKKLDLVAPGAVGRAVDGKLYPLVAEAKQAWPKKTGISAGALRVRVENENGKIVRYVQDLVPYAGAIEFKDTEINVAEALVFEPIAKALEPMLEAFAREIARMG